MGKVQENLVNMESYGAVMSDRQFNKSKEIVVRGV